MASIQLVDGTRVIYYVDEEDTPYLVKLNAAAESVTLGDFKLALNKPNCKYFFKSIDDDFGVVKEEITEDSAKLPCFNGRVISWLVSADNCTGSSDGGGSGLNAAKLAALAGAQIGDGTQPATDKMRYGEKKINEIAKNSGTDCETCTEDTQSVQSAGQDRIAPLRSFHDYKHGSRYAGSHNHHSHHHHFGGNGATGSSVSSSRNHHRHHHPRGIYGSCGGAGGGSSVYEAPSSMMSSDLESTSFFESDGESSRFSGVTGTTMSSRYSRQRRQRRRRRRLLPISRASSFSSITDSTMSLNIVTVTLNMDSVPFLGISIVGQSTKSGDDGIYVGSIMKGGAVAQDGRIEPGDMILEVNGISFEDMSNDDAVRTLREQVQNPGSITLVVAKCWDADPRGGYFTIPRQEPVRPIDPRAWVLHTNAMTVAGGNQPGGPMRANGDSVGSHSSTSSGEDSVSTIGNRQKAAAAAGSGNSKGYNVAAMLAQQQQQQRLNQQQAHQQQQQQSLLSGFRLPPQASSGMLPGLSHKSAQSVVTFSSSLPDTDRSGFPSEQLTVATDVKTVIQAMRHPDSGLDIRDRVWLKITLPNAFIGSDLVDWLFRNVEGFPDRRDSRKYAANLLKFGLIRHSINKSTFSEQCYYVFSDFAGNFSALSLEEMDSVSEIGAVASASAAGVATASPQNWSHSTASTSLTGGGMRNVVAPPVVVMTSQSQGRCQQAMPVSNVAGQFAPAISSSVFHSDGGQLLRQQQHPALPNGYGLQNSSVMDTPLQQIISSGSSSSSSCESARDNTLSRPEETDSNGICAGHGGIFLSGGLSSFHGAHQSQTPTVAQNMESAVGLQSQTTPLAGAANRSISSGSSTEDDDDEGANHSPTPLVTKQPVPSILQSAPGLSRPLPPPRAIPATSLYLNS